MDVEKAESSGGKGREKAKKHFCSVFEGTRLGWWHGFYFSQTAGKVMNCTIVQTARGFTT